MEKSVEEALNHQNGTKQADTTDDSENLTDDSEIPVDCLEGASRCEETGEEEYGVKVERMLSELTQLNREMEEEKVKSRRLHQENENLDLELELILERLK